MQSQYRDLMDFWAKETCQQEERDDGQLIHSKDCPRCNAKRKAKDLKITPYEWPLPKDTNPEKCCDAAHNTVFELALPLVYSFWRDSTLFILNSVLGLSSSAVGSQTRSQLNSYPGLEKRFKAPENFENRLKLVSASAFKPPTASSGLSMLEITEQNICLGTQARWSYYDFERGSVVDLFETPEQISQETCFLLPEESKSLQLCLNPPSPKPPGWPVNATLARRNECPAHIPVSDFLSLSLLPVGNRLKWINIVRELETPTIDWKTPESLLVLLQITSVLGPPEETEGTDFAVRESHDILKYEHINMSLLSVMYSMIEQHRGNWDAVWIVAALSTIACRILSIGHQRIKPAVLGFLRDCQAVCSQWIHRLSQSNLYGSTGGDVEHHTRRKRFEVALAGAATFDVDEAHMRLRIKHSSDSSGFMDFGIFLHRDLTEMSNQNIFHRVFFQRWQRLGFLLCPHLSRDLRFLDGVVKKHSPNYELLEEWQHSNGWATNQV